MKSNNLFLLITFSFWNHSIISQNIVYQEDFEQPSGANSISANGSLPSNNYTWKVSSELSTDGNAFFHVKGVRGHTSYFETDAFSTDEFVTLELDQVVKTANPARVEVSIDNGLTWETITDQQYKGNQELGFPGEPNCFWAGSYYLWDNDYMPVHSLWLHEAFNLTGLASDTVNHTGYSQVKLRFELSASDTVRPKQGWYVDNIVVRSGTCNFDPLFLNWHVSPIVEFSTPCFRNYPQGDLVETTLGYMPVIIGSDYFGEVDSAIVYYQVNNSAFRSVNMEKRGNMSFYYDTVYYGILEGISESDTVSYYLGFYGNFPNSCTSGSFREPYDSSGYYHFQIVPPLPKKCGEPECQENMGMLKIDDSILPWKEDFEREYWRPGNNGHVLDGNHRGSFPIPGPFGWTIIPSRTANENPFAWCLADSATYTTETGPDRNHTPGGSKYLYTEGSLGREFDNLKLSSLYTPCIDLTEHTGPLSFEMFYHMFGDSSMRILRVDVDTGTDNSAWINRYIEIWGAQQSSAADPWQRTVCSLEPFNGKIIRLNIMAVRQGKSERADIAIDDLRIFEPDSQDVFLSSIMSPGDGECSYSSSESLTVILQNTGIIKQYSVPLAYQLNNGNIIRDTISADFTSSNTMSFTFPANIDLSAYKSHEIKVWTELDNDVRTDDDTLSIRLKHMKVLNSFPYREGFESSIPASQLTENGNLLSDYFTVIDDSVEQYRWNVYKGPVRDTYGGPLGGSHMLGNYLLYYSDNKPAQSIIRSSCIDLRGLTNPQMTFKFYRAVWIGPSIRVREQGNSYWKELLRSSTQVPSTQIKDKEFGEILIDLQEYSGKIIEIEFSAKTVSNPYSHQYYYAIDDIFIFNRESTDLSLISMEAPKFSFDAGVSELKVDLTFLNTGDNISVNSTLKVQLRNLCHPIPLITGQVSLPAQNLINTKRVEDTILFNTPVPAGWYEFKIWHETNGDNNYLNDTIIKHIQVISTENVPYATGFEDCYTPFYTEGELLDWQKSSPEKGDWSDSFNGDQCMITHPVENLASSEEILYSPVFIGGDSLYKGILSFYHRFEFGIEGYGVVEYYDRATQSWKNLSGTSAYDGENWMNSPYVQNIPAYPDGPVFTGDSKKWIFSSYVLDSIGQRDSVKFRFIATGDNVKGWAIDDFSITPARTSVSPVETKWDTVPVAGSNNLKLKVRNTGSVNIASFDIEVIANDNIVYSQNFNMTDSLKPNENTTVLLSSVSLSSGMNSIRIISSLPNLVPDQKKDDDTLKMTLYTSLIIDEFPYCSDFESERTFINFSMTSPGSYDSIWVLGSPEKSLINSGFNSENCWYIARDSLYGSDLDQYLYSPVFYLKEEKCYKLSFKHIYDTEPFTDGGTIEYTVDSGASWNLLGNSNDSNWFNSVSIDAFNPGIPGWSGTSAGWESASKNIELFEESVFQFRFRFASNGTGFYEGWAIDDLCLQEFDNCHISLIHEDIYSDLKVYPNPAKTKLNIVIPLRYTPFCTIEVIDARGRLVTHEEIRVNGSTPYTLNIANLQKGIYMLRISGNGYFSWKKIIKNGSVVR